ncbi:MAG: RNA polymerase sigma factor [Clostridia bacterium]|nr:RNA polymerase sigma factor [Clostridia bacterium]
MEQKKVNRLVEENMRKVFAWCLAKVYHRQDAEDLTADILCAVIRSGGKIKSDDAFYGYLWKVAKNSLASYIRNKRREYMPYDESFVGVFWQDPASDAIRGEQFSALRRELAILSGKYREVTVQHYIYSKSCSEISAELKISVEMVKYYLFQSRKTLKEGIEMAREFGEKSYNPGVFRPDFWGGNNTYQNLFKRKLPGNILLASLDEPLSLSEMSVELGVAAAYLEDEVEILCENELMKKVGNRYQTNIVIITEEFEREFSKESSNVIKKTASEMETLFARSFPELKALVFRGKSNNENTLKWQYLNIALMSAMFESDKYGKDKFGGYPKLSNGSFGFVFGYDNDYVHHKFNGIYGEYESEDETAMVSVENYRMLDGVQRFVPYNWTDSMNALIDAVLEKEADEKNDELIRLISEGFIISDRGRLSANFAVFPESLFSGDLKTLLAPVVNAAREGMIEIALSSGDLLASYVPQHLRDTAKRIAFIKSQMDSMAFLFEQMLSDGALEMPTDTVMPCMYGVDKRK